MAVLDELRQEAVRRASSPEGMATLVHSLLTAFEFQALQARRSFNPELELHALLRSYVLAKRQIAYLGKQASYRYYTTNSEEVREIIYKRIESLQSNVVSLRYQIAEFEVILGKDRVDEIKKSLGAISFGYGAVTKMVWPTDFP